MTDVSDGLVANGKLALCVNPMSGRDVRRLAARAANMTHEAKRDIVARVAAGADAVGVTDIYGGENLLAPIATSTISTGALELMPLASMPKSTSWISR